MYIRQEGHGSGESNFQINNRHIENSKTVTNCSFSFPFLIKVKAIESLLEGITSVQRPIIPVTIAFRCGQSTFSYMDEDTNSIVLMQC